MSKQLHELVAAWRREAEIYHNKADIALAKGESWSAMMAAACALRSCSKQLAQVLDQIERGKANEH